MSRFLYVPYFGAVEGIVVLYSIVKTLPTSNAQYREFWLARVGQAHQLIDTIYPFHVVSYSGSGSTGISDTAANTGFDFSYSWQNSVSSGVFPSGVNNIFENGDPSSPDLSFSGSGTRFRESDLSYTETGDVEASEGGIYYTNAITVEASTTASATLTPIPDFDSLGGDGDDQVLSETVIFEARLNGASIGASANVLHPFSSNATDSDSDTLVLGQDLEMAAEGYLSPGLRITIKAQFEESQFWAIRHGSPSNPDSYQRFVDGSPTIDASGDWREPIVSIFQTAFAASQSPDSCVAAYADNPFATLQDGTLYLINSIGLEAALQTAGIGSTYTGTLTTRTATSGASCSLGAASTQSVEIPGIPATAELLSAVFIP